MAKNAWLVIPDLHLWHKNISSRVDYVGEMKAVREDIERIAIKYRQQNFEKVNMLLLGDIFHRSYQNTFSTGYDVMFFVMWREVLGDIYSVIGNHELHYYSANPFFTLVSEIESKKIHDTCSEVWTPRGLLPIIRVPDVVIDGDVIFHFNHFGTSINRPENNKINIGLFHQELVDYKIVREMEAKLGEKVFSNPIEFENFNGLDGYQYCFFGHLHKVYGMYKGDNTVLYYLGSLGRTNAGEVNDNFLERCIPAILVDNGKFLCVEENKITLPSRAKCVKEDVVKKSKEWYEQAKIVKAARNYEVTNDDPVQGLREYFVDDPVSIKIINGLLNANVDDVGESLTRKFNKIIGGSQL